MSSIFELRRKIIELECIVNLYCLFYYVLGDVNKYVLRNIYSADVYCIMDKYVVGEQIDEGRFGTVLKAIRKLDGETVALKRVFCSGQNIETKLREIDILQQSSSQYVVKLLDVVFVNSTLILEMEYSPCDLGVVLREQLLNRSRLPLTVVKAYTLMLLKGLDYCHELGIMHRDLKPANLLLSFSGILKIADFGLSRLMENGSAQFRDAKYTHQVASRYYRAPELLFGSENYDQSVDMWAVGCIFGEMLRNRPLFRGQNDIDQLRVVLVSLGTPNEDSWPGLSKLPDFNKIHFTFCKGKSFRTIIGAIVGDSELDFISRLLVFDPSKRMTADKALKHSLFTTYPLPLPKNRLPRQTERKAATKQNNRSVQLGKHLTSLDEQLAALKLSAKPTGSKTSRLRNLTALR